MKTELQKEIAFFKTLSANIHKRGYYKHGHSFYYPCACGDSITRFDTKQQKAVIVCSRCTHQHCKCREMVPAK